MVARVEPSLRAVNVAAIEAMYDALLDRVGHRLYEVFGWPLSDYRTVYGGPATALHWYWSEPGRTVDDCLGLFDEARTVLADGRPNLVLDGYVAMVQRLRGQPAEHPSLVAVWREAARLHLDLKESAWVDTGAAPGDGRAQSKWAFLRAGAVGHDFKPGSLPPDPPPGRGPFTMFQSRTSLAWQWELWREDGTPFVAGDDTADLPPGFFDGDPPYPDSVLVRMPPETWITPDDPRARLTRRVPAAAVELAGL